MQALDDEGRAPDVIVVENVIGLLTSHRGADLAALLAALKGRGYRAGALEVDASAFSPQSRPRLFIVAARRTVSGNTTVLASDGVLEVNAAGGSVRITYPLVLGAAALVQLVTIVKTDATNNPVLIVSDADVTVPLGALISPADGDNMQSAIVYSDGADLRFI